MTNIDFTKHLSEAIKNALVADGENVTSAELVRAEGDVLAGQLVVLTLTYEDGTTMDVSFYVYGDGTWFSPWDWHSWQPTNKSDVHEIDWQLGVTGRKAVIFGGEPRILFS